MTRPPLPAEIDVDITLKLAEIKRRAVAGVLGGDPVFAAGRQVKQGSKEVAILQAQVRTKIPGEWVIAAVFEERLPFPVAALQVCPVRQAGAERLPQRRAIIQIAAEAIAGAPEIARPDQAAFRVVP